MKYPLSFILTHAPAPDAPECDPIPATVPGAVQTDYAAALSYPPYWQGENFRMYDWMEDELFFYRTTLSFDLADGQQAFLCFEGIDYGYEITLGERRIVGQGAFTPVILDVSDFAGKPTPLCVKLLAIPKRVAEPRDRVQASGSCKPPSSYEWDWHPRLVPKGIYKDAYLQILPSGSIGREQVSYRLSEDLDQVTVTAEATVFGGGRVALSLLDPQGREVARQERVSAGGREHFLVTLDHPMLWYPRGYGEQNRYTLVFSSLDGGEGCERAVGFRRSRLVLNHGAEALEGPFPKGPSPSPMQLQINHRDIFCKGSNWVNTEIFPSLATPERYRELIDLAVSANMNIFRLWGGQYIPHDAFYDYCDRVGMLVWQEFPLSCNCYPDEDGYLAVLKQEATSIVRALRTHPCLAFWCGGNELFNSWSGMTNQSHALRMLDAICLTHDRFTPFQYTSPTHGVSHGTYTKVLRDEISGEEGEEFLTRLSRCHSTAYTEFGVCGASSREYMTRYIMSEADFDDCRPDHPIWRAHHAFDAWSKDNWLNPGEVIYYFGGYESTDDLVEKSIYLQALCYQTTFEEMRRQAPLCSMAVNWDFNEPWPTAAGNSLINWPAHPKPCLAAVGQALRDRMLSLEMGRNRYLTGDTLTGRVWVLNDTDESSPSLTYRVEMVCGEEETLLWRGRAEAVSPRTNAALDRFSVSVTAAVPSRFTLRVICEEDEALSSEYHLVHRI